MDRGRDARPDVEALWLSRRYLHSCEYPVDDIIDNDEIAHNPTVFVDLQRRCSCANRANSVTTPVCELVSDCSCSTSTVHLRVQDAHDEPQTL